MIEYFLLVLILFIVLAGYLTIIKPYLVYKKYVKLLPSLGYKTFIHPFKPLGAGVRDMMSKDKQIYGDTAKSFKEVYPHFDISVCNIHNETVLELINPDLIKEFYKNTNQNHYVKADVMTSSFKMLLQNGILMKQGHQWKQRKKIISSVFTHDFIILLMPQIHKICQNRFDQMEKKCKIDSAKKDVQVFEVDMHLVFQQIFSQVIVRLFFGSEPSETLNGKNICEFINELMAGIMKELKSPLFAIFGQIVASKQLKQNLKSFKQLARNLINKRLKQIQFQIQKPTNPRDIIEALVLSGQFSYKQKKQEKNEDVLTFDDLIGEFCTFFVAGMDTTSNFLTSLVYHLAKQQSKPILQKIREEAELVFKEKQSKWLTFKDLKKMNFIDMVQKQGLRMFTPVNGIFFRKATKSHQLNDIPIAKGMTVVARIRPNLFQEEYFPDPFTFKPQRWSEPNPKLHSYAYLPFSSGARTCIGNHLSLMESKLVLAELVTRYDSIKLQKQDYKMISTFLYAPQKVKMTLEKKIK